MNHENYGFHVLFFETWGYHITLSYDGIMGMYYNSWVLMIKIRNTMMIIIRRRIMNMQ